MARLVQHRFADGEKRVHDGRSPAVHLLLERL